MTIKFSHWLQLQTTVMEVLARQYLQTYYDHKLTLVTVVTMTAVMKMMRVMRRRDLHSLTMM